MCVTYEIRIHWNIYSSFVIDIGQRTSETRDAKRREKKIK